MPPAERLLVVSTHSRLRGVRFFPVMLLASWRIRRQLAVTDGVVRWASIIAGPTEFWTVTVWRSRHAMQEFMRSGAHGEIMWSISRWLSSFWLMRWRAGPAQTGSWDGMALAPTALPATGPDGPPSYDSAPLVRLRREQLAGASAVLVRTRTPLSGVPASLVRLHRLRGRLRADPDMVRAVLGVGRLGECYLLAVWRDGDGGHDLVSSGQLTAPGWWASEWLPESEFGHWEGLRLRRERRRISACRTAPPPGRRPADSGRARPR